MIDEGRYTAHLVSVTFGKSKGTGTPCIASEWAIEGEDTNRTVYTYLSKKAKKNSYKKLKAMGFNGDYADPDFTVTTTELLCTHEEYTNKETDETEDRERWEFANWGSPGIEDADAKTIKQLNAEWKRESGEKSSSAAAAAPSKPKPAKKKAAGKSKSEPEPEEVEPEIPEPEDEDIDETEPAESEGEDKDPYTLAWEAFVEKCATDKALNGLENGKRAVALKEWAALLERAVPDKDEEDFNNEDWEEVRSTAGVPF